MLLSIAERAGAVELSPGAAGWPARVAHRPGQPASGVRGDQGGEGPQLGVVPLDRALHDGAAECRRRQILDHFGDPQEGAPSGRCCDVCDPDPLLERALAAPPGAGAARSRGGRAGSLDAADEARFEQLRAWRSARAEGKPAYTVASNAVLVELLQQRPASLATLLEIRGIGPAFCEKHGASLLEALAGL